MTTNLPRPVALKSAIIGKMWINQASAEIVPASYVLSQDMTFGANQSFLLGNLTFRTDRNLSSVTVKAGERLFFYANTKRPGFRDPDYSVSVLLPAKEAEAVIANSRAGAQAWRAANPVA